MARPEQVDHRSGVQSDYWFASTFLALPSNGRLGLRLAFGEETKRDPVVTFRAKSV